MTVSDVGGRWERLGSVFGVCNPFRGLSFTERGDLLDVGELKGALGEDGDVFSAFPLRFRNF